MLNSHTFLAFDLHPEAGSGFNAVGVSLGPDRLMQAMRHSRVRSLMASVRDDVVEPRRVGFAASDPPEVRQHAYIFHQVDLLHGFICCSIDFT